MKDTDIIKYLKSNIEPIPDDIYGDRYRVAAYLKDGTYLPCVVFQSKRKQVNLALKRFDATRKQSDQYRMVVESFVADCSNVASHDIFRVESSPFAIPLNIIKKISGETSMGWTEFVVEMYDGKRFPYGTAFLVEFFELPDGYRIKDIKEIHCDIDPSESKETRHYFREKPFFTCYVDGI